MRTTCLSKTAECLKIPLLEHFQSLFLFSKLRAEIIQICEVLFMSRLGFRPLIYNLNSKAKDPDRELDNHATDMKLLVEIHLRVECICGV